MEDTFKKTNCFLTKMSWWKKTKKKSGINLSNLVENQGTSWDKKVVTLTRYESLFTKSENGALKSLGLSVLDAFLEETVSWN